MNPLINNQNNTNNRNIFQEFANFKKQMEGKNPEEVLNQLIQSGQVSKEQMESAVNTAKQLSQFLGLK